MKLFKLTQDVNNDYDTYDSIIVCAEDEDDAKTIDPNGDVCKEVCEPYSSWCGQKDVQVKYIGEAYSLLGRGVILASFNAG